MKPSLHGIHFFNITYLIISNLTPFCPAPVHRFTLEAVGHPERMFDTTFDEGVATETIDSIIDSAYRTTTYYKLQTNLYTQLKLIVDSMGIDSIGDSILVSFYQNADTGNIGNFSRLYDSINVLLDSASVMDTTGLFATNISNLQAQNLSYKPTSTAETKEQQMNDFTLSYWLLDTLTTTQQDFIYNLAFSCVYSNGPAVYIARTYYRAVFHDDSTQFNDDTICAYELSHRMLRITNRPDTALNNNKQVTVFPNPATDKVYFVTSLNADETGTVTVYNIEGIKVKEIKVSGGITTNVLQTGNLANGVYLYYLNTNQQYNARGKIVITK